MLVYSWTLAKEGHNVLDFGLQERVNWREEGTGIAARKWSTAAIHAAEGALAPARGHALSKAQQRHSCAGAPAWARTLVHAQAHAQAAARAPAPACASVHAQAHALAGARARESRRGPCGTPWHQARRQCAAPSPSMPRGWALAQSGRREPERERGDTSPMYLYFLLFHAIILSTLDVLYALLCYFISFFGTNL